MTTTTNYGVSESNNLRDVGMENWLPNGAPTVGWADPDLDKITRLRLVSDPGFPMWDVSYCWGQLFDGTRVRVQLPFGQLPRRGTREAIVAAAMRDGVYAKGLGVFDAISTLV